MRSVTVKFGALLALMGSSTVAVAADPSSRAPAVQAQAPSPWLMLSALSSTRSVALAGSTAAAQPNDGSAPPPPPPYVGAGPVIGGEVVGILVWFAFIAIALGNDPGSGVGSVSGTPNSPG